MIIGSHVSFGSNQLLGCTKEAISYNANTFMFYTGAPHNTMRSIINDSYTMEAYKLMKENNIDLSSIVCHAPYIINLANNSDPKKYKFSIDFLISEIERCNLLGVKNVVIHPGNSLELSKSESLDVLVNALSIVINNTENVDILIETMAGKGTEVCSNLDELSYVINKTNIDRIGVCLDTCHLNDAGYNLINFNSFLDEFDSKIGIKFIKCVHINDSKNSINTHKDRHENIGFGSIGFDTILSIIYSERLKDVPKILETPYVRDYPPYKYEIEMIKNKCFNPNLPEDIQSQK